MRGWEPAREGMVFLAHPKGIREKGERQSRSAALPIPGLIQCALFLVLLLAGCAFLIGAQASSGCSPELETRVTLEPSQTTGFVTCRLTLSSLSSGAVLLEPRVEVPVGDKGGISGQIEFGGRTYRVGLAEAVQTTSVDYSVEVRRESEVVQRHKGSIKPLTSFNVQP
jgi:hypothetical protein